MSYLSDTATFACVAVLPIFGCVSSSGASSTTCVSNSLTLGRDLCSLPVILSLVQDFSVLDPTEQVWLLFAKNDSIVLGFLGGPDILI